MQTSLFFIRSIILLLSSLIATSYALLSAEEMSLAHGVIGLVAGAVFGLFLIACESFYKRCNLRSFNLALLGLFCGYLLGEAILTIFNATLQNSLIQLSSQKQDLLRIGVFLFTSYFGMTLAARAADEIQITLPFIKFKPQSHKQKEVLPDLSALCDNRIIDLASSGLLDHQLVIPRFILKELTAQLESTDEGQKSRARRSLDIIKKMESIPFLEMRYVETEIPEITDVTAKLTRLARLLEASLLTSDLSRVQQAQLDGIRIININLLANALKPLNQSGEFIHIKIQRYGKEPRQGVGYLEDGTMVVVNGGAEYIGETIKAQVLSVKHTTSGRMIFCNAAEEGELCGVSEGFSDLEESPFTL